MSTPTGRQAVIVSRHQEKMQCEVLAISDWEGFEKLVAFLQRTYGAVVVSRADGPDARRWVLAIGQEEMKFNTRTPGATHSWPAVHPPKPCSRESPRISLFGSPP